MISLPPPNLNCDYLAPGRSPARLVNKNQIQELLLGIGLSLRNLDFANFVDDYDEVLVPPYLMSGDRGVAHS